MPVLGSSSSTPDEGVAGYRTQSSYQLPEMLVAVSQTVADVHTAH